MWFKYMSCGVFAAVFLGGVGYGIYTMSLGVRDEHGSEVREMNEVIEHWNDAVIGRFANLSLTVRSEGAKEGAPLLEESSSKDWTSKGTELETYQTKLYLASASFFGGNYSFESQNSGLKEYEVSGTLVLSTNLSGTLIDSIMENVTVFRRTTFSSYRCSDGYWDDETDECYYHYALSTLCVLYNQTENKLVAEYPTGCDGVSMEAYERMHWRAPDPPSALNYSFTIEVRSMDDPYVYSVLEGLERLETSSGQYIYLSFVIIVFSCFLLMIPALYLYRRLRKRLRQYSQQHNKEEIRNNAI